MHIGPVVCGECGGVDFRLNQEKPDDESWFNQYMQGDVHGQLVLVCSSCKNRVTIGITPARVTLDGTAFVDSKLSPA